ncbi:fibronectin type III domain-containing protein, partial [Nitrospira sp. BLG_2]|uniref:fibronectin type III domain-containing protein n=1 Tax=Nitrospira sp. BLG_2 TaxID=3397507 RepID=UPI003B995E6C
EVQYRLTLVNNVQSSPTLAAATFSGSTAAEMKLGYAVALSNTTVLLTFNQAVDTVSAQTTANYTIDNPDLKVFSAVKGVGNNLAHTVTLTTGPQSDQPYTIRAVNIANSVNNTLIDPDKNTATFYGIAATDTTAPRLLTAEAASPTSILLSFSEPLENFASEVANYSVAFTSGALPVIGVQVNTWGTQVLVSVVPMTPGTNYTVTVNNVEDRSFNVINPTAKTASFTYVDLDAGDPDSVLPRVTGAISTGNRTVLVTFNKPMSDLALVPSNYFIIQKNQQPEAGYLTVTDAAFLGDSRTTVRLATLSQSELTYVIRVINVEDMQGNQMQPPDLLVDPATATFPGTPPTCHPACASGSAHSGGTDGHGACSTDDDCDNDAPCTVGESDCAGKCADNCEFDDTDGDGLTDAEEQRGWKVEVELVAKDGTPNSRQFIQRDVTSNPLTPDTDLDGLSDSLEKQLATDPRDKDTDDDLVLDEREYNLYYTNLLDQDSDNDGIDEQLEITFFHTSPIMADTDGDQMSDSEELFERSRNPLLAELPVPQITVEDIALELNISSSFTDEQGTTTSIEDNTSTTFTQSRTNTLGTSETN